MRSKRKPRQKKLIRVGIIDDHQVVRSGLLSLLEGEKTIAVISEFSDGASFIDAYSIMESLDVVLLDISMPKAGGLAVMEMLSRQEKPPSVIILSVHPEETHALHAVNAGAKGYLNKQCDKKTLVEAITCVAHGGMYFTKKARSLIFRETAKTVQCSEVLSPQELMVFTGICKGLSNKEISFTMDISVKSVSTYKNRLMEKLRARNLADLIRIGISWGV